MNVVLKWLGNAAVRLLTSVRSRSPRYVSSIHRRGAEVQLYLHKFVTN